MPSNARIIHPLRNIVKGWKKALVGVPAPLSRAIIQNMSLPQPVNIPQSLKITPPPSRRIVQIGRIQKLTDLDLQKYLSDFSMEETRQYRELWKSNAARRELIGFGSDAGRKYGFDPESMTYFIDRGNVQKEIPTHAIKLDVNRFAIAMQNQQRALMAGMIAGRLTSQEWYDESIRLMKLSYRATADVARGTNRDMNDEEKKRWLILILLLFTLLNGLAENLENGILPINGRLPIYAGLRGAALRSLFENWRLHESKVRGFTEGRRFLGFAEHCHPSKDRPGCIELAALGWLPIEKVVPIGGATCLDNCKCEIHIRKKDKPLLFWRV